MSFEQCRLSLKNSLLVRMLFVLIHINFSNSLKRKISWNNYLFYNIFLCNKFQKFILYFFTELLEYIELRYTSTTYNCDGLKSLIVLFLVVIVSWVSSILLNAIIKIFTIYYENIAKSHYNIDTATQRYVPTMLKSSPA